MDDEESRDVGLTLALALINANVKPRPLEESQKIGDI